MNDFNRQTFDLLKLLLVSSLLVLGACGGGSSDDDDDDNVLTGRFIDSAVSGLWFETPTRSGFTDANGRFRYHAGETVGFFVGDIEIGEARGNLVLTPIDLVPAAVDTSNQKVVNIIRFVQSLDDDANPDNGIVITRTLFDRAVGEAIDFALDPAAFEFSANALLTTLTSGAVNALVSSVDAIAHFNGTFSSGSGSGILSIGGTDTAVIGSSFEPFTVADIIDNGSGIVSFNDPPMGINVSITNGTIGSVNLTYASINDPFNVYSYALNCFVNSCPGITLDVAGRSIGFASTSIPVSLFGQAGSLTNVATAPITLDGTLTW